MLKAISLPSPTYLERKLKEIHILDPELAKAFPWKSRTYQEAFHQKLEFKNLVKKKYIADPLLGISNLSNSKKARYAGYQVRYSYQRSGIELIDARFDQLLYGLDFPKHEAFLTQNGQSALSNLLHALKLRYKKLALNQEQVQVYCEGFYHDESVRILGSRLPSVMEKIKFSTSRFSRVSRTINRNCN